MDVRSKPVPPDHGEIEDPDFDEVDEDASLEDLYLRADATPKGSPGPDGPDGSKVGD